MQGCVQALPATLSVWPCFVLGGDGHIRHCSELLVLHSGNHSCCIGVVWGAWNPACPQKRQALFPLCCHYSPKLLLLLQSTLLCFSVNGVFKEGKSPQSLISQLTPVSSDLALSPFPCSLAAPPLPSLLPSFLSGERPRSRTDFDLQQYVGVFQPWFSACGASVHRVPQSPGQFLCKRKLMKGTSQCYQGEEVK